MDIKPMGFLYASPYQSSVKINDKVAFQSKNWPSDLQKRLAASANGFSATAIMKNELGSLQISPEELRKLRDLLDSMLTVIRNLQTEKRVLQTRMNEVQHTNNRFRIKVRK